MSGNKSAKVSWGLLGASGIANRALATAIAESAHGSLVAVASRDPEKAGTFAAKHAIGRSYGSYEALLADKEVEVVYVSLPNSEHVTWAMRAVEAGKHVLCEKPMHCDASEVNRLYDAAERAGRIVMEAFMYRHHPDTQTLFRCVTNGDIGEVYHARAALSFSMPLAGNIRLDPALHGGALMDLGCYAISALRILAGEPSRVSGVAIPGPTGVDMRATAFMKCPQGATATFNCGMDLPGQSGLEVIGSKGILRAEWPFFRPFFPHIDPPKIEIRVGLESRLLPLTDANPYVMQVDNLSRSIRSEEQPLLGRLDACAQARVIGALRRSMSSAGEWVTT
jgi:predicted dehydrogenase